jgi:hypothetical protein
LALTSKLMPEALAWQPPQAPDLPLPKRSNSPAAHGSDPRRSDVYAFTALVEGVGLLRQRNLFHSLRTHCEREGRQMLRLSAGGIDTRRMLVLTLWRDRPEALLEAAYLTSFVEALRQDIGASWAMGWKAGEYEIGRWDQLRLCQLAARARQERVSQR